MPRTRRSSDSYDAEARFYDYTWDGLTADIEFYRRRLRHARTVLDAMCGTGRVTVALARSGLEVWGVDRSSEMLARARERLRSETEAVRRRVRLKQRDLVRGAAGHDLDAALIAVNSYGLILSSRDRIRALRQIRACLRPGGTLLLAMDSVRSYRTVRDGVPFLTTTRVVGPRGRIYVRVFAETGAAAKIVRSESLHLLLSPTGRVLTTAESRTMTTVLSPAQVKRELRSAGFAPGAMFGDYDQSRYAPSGPRYVLESTAR